MKWYLWSGNRGKQKFGVSRWNQLQNAEATASPVANRLLEQAISRKFDQGEKVLSATPNAAIPSDCSIFQGSIVFCRT